MGLFDNIRNAFSGAETKKVNSMVGYFGVQDSGKSYKYQDLAKEGYQKNAIVYRCVNEIAKGASAVPFHIKSGDDVLEQHPLIDLLNRPNPLQSNSEFFNSLFGYLLLSGNAYVLKVGGLAGQPKELHLLRPDRIEIKAGSGYMPERYDYVINGKILTSYEVDQDTGMGDLKQIKLWNPLDDYHGLSPLAAAAVEVDQHNLASTHNISLLSNGARPSGAIIFKPQDDAGFTANLSDSQRQQLLTDLNRRFSGTSNAGRPMLLEGDFDWKEMGLSPKDMDFLNLKHMSSTDIALCFGVPSQLVGVPDSQTYANVAEARLALYEETIIPYLRKIESDINEWLIPQFNENIKFQYIVDEIPALSERRRRIYENITTAVSQGIMTRNEAREMIGLSPVDGADELLVAANLFPLGSNEVPPTDAGNERDAEEYEEEDEDEKAQIRRDVFTTEAEALARAGEIGCVGSHSHDEDGRLVYMPCKTHDEYIELTGRDVSGNKDFDFVSEEDEKALADLDLTPTDGMSEEAARGLAWRKKHNRGGTQVGATRANQLVRKERLSVDTVLRMHSFFSRHEVDKQAEGFSQGEDGYPSAGRIAWALWGGDAGQSWAKKKRDQIEREREKKKLTGAVKEGLKEKVKEHNEKYGDSKTKRVTLGMLEKVFNRGVGAYRTNPQSVRPSVRSPEQWAYARVNSFLYALRNGKFRGGKHDTDVFPEGHPLRSKEKIALVV